MFESSRTSCELASEELGSRGMGLARAFDEDAAMSILNRNENRTQGWRKILTPIELWQFTDPS